MDSPAVSLHGFDVVRGDQIRHSIFANVDDIIESVRNAYIAHEQGRTVNPPSAFLKFPQQPRDRIIALPAHIRNFNGASLTGIKWISSFPGNLERNVPRASAVVLLNHPETGYPYACMEGASISAARTAASAVLAALELNGRKKAVDSLGFIGTGVISQHIFDFFAASGWNIGTLHAHDAAPTHALRFAQRSSAYVSDGYQLHDNPGTLIRSCDMTVFATTAPTPYFDDPSALDHNPILLHISLRDLSPQLILRSHNVVDDIDHCMNGNTSPHLAEQITGRRDFVRYTLPGILVSGDAPDKSKPIIFSPFGMGILDLAVGKYVYEKARADDKLISIPNFFADNA